MTHSTDQQTDTAFPEMISVITRQLLNPYHQKILPELTRQLMKHCFANLETSEGYIDFIINVGEICIRPVSFSGFGERLFVNVAGGMF
ncbi:hypothetical protein HA41_17010 [Pantoea conspicua]|uniref:Uncharacterized protein n=1 Tax=Pantoea conspicua TaxID=472705 RepID=A0A1X1BSA3_9GAMM|nr:hypothetical protein [Pantoea conspicua]ORM51001.1 hypothetical protein HA41_17010 [Pantoea conspicua]